MVVARDFWQLMCGAYIRYNVLQEKHGTSSLRQEFETEWDEWLADLQAFPGQRWGTGLLWEQTKLHHRRVKEYTIDFVQSWIDGLCEGTEMSKLGNWFQSRSVSTRGVVPVYTPLRTRVSESGLELLI